MEKLAFVVMVEFWWLLRRFCTRECVGIVNILVEVRKYCIMVNQKSRRTVKIWWINFQMLYSKRRALNISDGTRTELLKAAVPRRLMRQSLLVVETPVRRFRYGGAVLASSLRVGTIESVGHHNL